MNSAWLWETHYITQKEVHWSSVILFESMLQQERDPCFDERLSSCFAETEIILTDPFRVSAEGFSLRRSQVRVSGIVHEEWVSYWVWSSADTPMNLDRPLVTHHVKCDFFRRVANHFLRRFPRHWREYLVYYVHGIGTGTNTCTAVELSKVQRPFSIWFKLFSGVGSGQE